MARRGSRKNAIGVAACAALVFGLVHPADARPPDPPVAAATEAPRVPEGQPEVGWLGVWLTDAVDGGVQIVAVWPGGPADRSGIRSGDVVLEAAGRAVLDQADLGRVVAERGAGEELKVLLLRGSEEHRMAIRLGTKLSLRPAPPGTSQSPSPRLAPLASPGSGLDAVGIEVEPMTPALRRYLGAPETSGVLVTRVVTGRVADEAGLQVGDVIVQLGDEEVSSAGQVRGTLAPWRSEPLAVHVVRRRQPIEIRLRVMPSDVERAPAISATRDSVRRRIEQEIERLERRIDELRREAEALEQAD